MYAVGYVRVSTEEQTATPDEQKRSIEELCRRKGWRLLGVYSDIGVSGATDPLSRTGFSRAVEALKSVGGGFLVAWSLDRISRQGFYRQLQLIAELAKHGIYIYTVVEEPIFMQLYGDVTNPLALVQAGSFLEFRAFLAKLEREWNRLRTRLAMRNPRVREKLLKGMQEKGYTVTEYLPDDVKQKILEMRRQGYAIRKIAEKLGLSYRVVYKIVKQAGEPGPSERTCPRCFHRMKLEHDIPPRLYCPNCGYERLLLPKTLQQENKQETNTKRMDSGGPS